MKQIGIKWLAAPPPGRRFSVLVDLHLSYIYYRTLQYVMNSLLQRNKTIDDKMKKRKLLKHALAASGDTRAARRLWLDTLVTSKKKRGEKSAQCNPFMKLESAVRPVMKILLQRLNSAGRRLKTALFSGPVTNHFSPALCGRVWLKVLSRASAKKKMYMLTNFKYHTFMGRSQVASWQWKG